MKKNLIILLSFIFGSPALHAKVIRYPQVLSVKGQVQFSDVQEKSRKLTRGIQLIEKAKITTGPLAQVTLQLDATRSLIVEENSQVHLPSIGWDSQQVPLILLKNGSVSWKSEKGDVPYSIALSSDLFQFILPEGHFRFLFDPDKALARAQILKGNFVFAALNADETVSLSTGEEVTFQGVFEGGEIAYDLLLKGKKIPKGQLLKVKPIETKELVAQKNIEILEKNAEQAKIKSVQLEKKRRLSAGFICENPDGRLNQCAWVCEGASKKAKTCDVSLKEVSCFRVKCNGNGSWAEKVAVDSATALQRCLSPKSIVSECDY